MAKRIIAIVGKSGAGKTTIAKALAEATGYPYRSIDDFKGATRWTRMIQWIGNKRGPVITESNICPSGFADLLRKTPSMVIEVVCPDEVRLSRLKGRRHQFASTMPIGARVDLTVDGQDHDAASKVMARIR